MSIDKKTRRQHWNDQHAILRRLLMKDQDYRQAISLFFSHHESVHAAKLRAGARESFQDEVLGGLTEEQMRRIPKGSPHTVAWKIWHIARIEDVTINLLLADSPQVLNSGNWLDKLGITCVTAGNEMSTQDIVELSETINLKALLAYRLAVGKRTRSVVRHIKPTELWQPPPPERLKRVAEEGAVVAQSAWLLTYWGGHPRANLLLMPATRHCFVHLNEVERMRPKLKWPK
jgi:hypothetical protein